MKKYFITLLTFMIMTPITSAANSGPSEKCLETLAPLLHNLHMTFQDLKDPTKAAEFKKYYENKPDWGTIFSACYSFRPHYDCMGCKCAVQDDNDCIWHCKCCWGTTKC